MLESYMQTALSQIKKRESPNLILGLSHLSKNFTFFKQNHYMNQERKQYYSHCFILCFSLNEFEVKVRLYRKTLNFVILTKGV